ncbi:hypothetical protein Bca52824_046944 [Brassica carinata]|uniref:CCR4-NOT transcription complex subunit 10 n=1 Tax=Brassica carinata TaxID=52824 RepID=A0A8X7UPI5_BRACI|nr:hypothetical protein Bca52824_046944 [Brassica carinata]
MRRKKKIEVLHNIAIAEYFNNACSNSKKLLEDLNTVKKQSEEFAKEPLEAVNPGSNVSVSKHQFDSTITTLNIAVTWFHLHQYAKCLSILDPLFLNIEPLDETIALQICFLMLDSALACHDAVKFLEVFGHLDKSFGVGFGTHEEIGSTMQLSSNQLVTSDALKSDLAAAESGLCEEGLEYDNVLAKLRPKLMKPVGHIPANNLLKTIGERSILTVDVKLELQLYKVRSYFYEKPCGKPLLAAQCFQKASLVFCRQPLLWLRIAECCILALQKGLLEEGNTSSDRSEIRVHVIGKGKWRQLMMEENGFVELGGSAQWPKLSLPLARVCLSNSMYLLNVSLVNDYSKSDLESPLSVMINETKEASWSDHGDADTNSELKEAKGGMNQDIIQNSLSAYKDIRRRENHLLKQALLANMAYVELELENPIKALSAANSLLQLPDCSKIYVFLGHIYAAEALCLLNRPGEAGAHLSAYLLGQEDFKLPFAQEDFDPWRMNMSSDCEETSDCSTGNARDSLKPEEARGALFANLAALFATQGHYDQARPFIQHALTLLPNNVQATITAVYIDLMVGRSQDAVARLKQCTRVSFVPGRLEVRAS